MEKHTAHYPLEQIHKCIALGYYQFTGTARLSIYQMGMILRDALDVVLSLSPKDLYKSMTTYERHSLWQDVYKKTWQNSKLYIKLQMVDEETIIISFKLDEEW